LEAAHFIEKTGNKALNKAIVLFEKIAWTSKRKIYISDWLLSLI